MALDSNLVNSWVYAAAAVVLVVAADRVWQKNQSKWTNEPPMLPYTIPFVGHALSFGKSAQALIRTGACVAASATIPAIMAHNASQQGVS